MTPEEILHEWDAWVEDEFDDSERDTWPLVEALREVLLENVRLKQMLNAFYLGPN